MSELFQETIINGVAIKQEEEETFINPSSLCNQEINVKQEMQDVKTEPDNEPSSFGQHKAIFTKQQLVGPKRKNKVSVTVKAIKPSITIEGGLSSGEAMLRCFQTFNIPIRKVLSHQSPMKHQNKLSKKSIKRPPPGLIPLQPPNKSSMNDEAWEGQANDSGEVIISRRPHAQWTSPSSVGSWVTDSNDFANNAGKGIKLTPGMKVLRCEICNYVTNRTNNLNRHYNSMHVTLVQPEECCDVVFYTRADLTKHTRLCHPDSKFPCQYPGCQGYVFDRKALLKRHVLAVHLKDKPFLCPVCHYGSSHKSNLDRHMKTIHGMDPAMNALAASALNASPAGILEGKNLESVEDFIKLMMEKAAIANIIHNAAFGNADEMLTGLGPVKMEDMEETQKVNSDMGPTHQITPDMEETREITSEETKEITPLVEESHEMTPDMDEAFEMTPYFEEAKEITQPVVI